jgi:hypothetical protein
MLCTQSSQQSGHVPSRTARGNWPVALLIAVRAVTKRVVHKRG